MKFVVNGTLHPGKSREDLIAHVKDRSISDEAVAISSARA